MQRSQFKQSKPKESNQHQNDQENNEAHKDSAGTAGMEVNEEAWKKEKMPDLEAGSYWLTRIVFLRYLSFIYLVAFSVAFNQVVPLYFGFFLRQTTIYIYTNQ